MRAVVGVLVLALIGCPSETKPAPPVAAKEASSEPPEAAAPLPAASDAAPPATLPGPRRPLRTQAALRAAFKGKEVPGIVAVREDGISQAFGWNGIELTADQPVLVASFTKLWVAVAALRLVARKELTLDDEIKALVPELAGKPWADSTLRELLGHTSRVPELDNGFFGRADVDFSHAATTLAKELSPVTEKRGVWKYRNSEYAIAGAILEAKSGRTIADVLSREVFGPAHMRHAGIVVKGRPREVDFAPMGRTRPENFFTAGNGYASMDDLLSFFGALQGDVLLDAASKELLFAGEPRHDHAALGCWAYPYATSDGGTTLLVERPGSFGNVKLVTVFAPEEHRALVYWTTAAIELGKPRTKNSVASKLARALLD